MTLGDRNLEKHIGCMGGFLQIFDRGQRIYAPKRIPSPPASGATNSSLPDERSEMFPSSAENLTESPAAAEISVNVFDLKERLKNSRKLREGPRLSLDSRLRPRENADSDKNRRSPGVVARLMGLDALPEGGEPIKKAELRRSSSESRVPRDMRGFLVENNDENPKFRSATNFASESRKVSRIPPPKRLQSIQRRSYFNSQEFFPEPNRQKGMDEAAKDLDSLKQILEALQLKGLLHLKSKISSNLVSNHPIVVMKPVRKPFRRSEPVRRRPAVEEKPIQCRSPRPQDPNLRRKPLINNGNSSLPKSSPRKMMPELVTTRSPRSQRIRERISSPAEEATTTIASASSIISSSQFDLERSRTGPNLLERCDKLLNSLAAFTSTEQFAVRDQQPSPISVLDSWFLGEDNSPSPVKKRSIIFKDPFVDWENEDCRVGSRPSGMPESDYSDYAFVSDVVLAYDRCSNSSFDVYCSNSSFDVYSFLEQHHNATDTSQESTLHRRVLFDMVYEILDRKRHVSPWESFSRRLPQNCGVQLIREVWEEVKRVRDVAGEAEDLNEVTHKAIQKEMTFGEHEWNDTSTEMSDAVLYLERLVFKDLIGEMIQGLADVAGKEIRNPILRRKLFF